ncbi:uncharacterized protein BJX67DRAFT_283232 [Aspergillus lucknowensis]|uniref:Uncharacterized protein n=1 Tax=Aspergillus lucknowensis TaxID=176173 RepID=A0ABR4M0W0_9EURO
MAGPLCPRSGRLPRRAVSELCQVLQPHLSRSYSAVGHRKAGPGQSKLLRFALLKSLKPAHGGHPGAELEQQLRDVFIEEWPLSSPTPSWISRAPKGAPDDMEALIQTAQKVEDLWSILERWVVDRESCSLLSHEYSLVGDALRRCERSNSYGEILSFIHMLELRLKRFNGSASRDLYLLGIRYACLAFSEPPLEHYIRGYLNITKKKLSSVWRRRLVSELLSSFRAICFQNPKRDTSQMRQLIHGELDSSRPSLNNILSRSLERGIGRYLTLLVEAQSQTVHRELWDKLLQNISSESTVTQFGPAYEYALALADAGDSSAALAALTELSKRAGGDLPGISGFVRLNNILKHDSLRESLLCLVKEDQHPIILGEQLRRIEARLGITWQADKELHTGVSDPLCVASEQPILTIDGDSPGYGSSERLVAEIEALGCSRSERELTVICDLLDDHEGSLIPVYIPNWDASDARLFWAPQRSPIPLSEKHSLTNLDGYENGPSRDLGLIRLAPRENPFFRERSLHLIQLGCLLVERMPPSGDDLDISPKMEQTGYIVAFDRLNGVFAAIYAEEWFGSIDLISELQRLGTLHGVGRITAISPLKPARGNTTPTEICIHGGRIEADSVSTLDLDMRT